MKFQRPIIMGIFLFFFGAFAGLSLAADKISKEEALSKFIKANFQYKDGHYDEAIQLYEDILKGGLASGPLYYNLGNSYFQKNVLGKSILNYDRARQMMPRDHDLKANYQYASSLVKGQPAENTQPVGQNFWEGFIGSFTPDELAFFAFILALATGILYLLSLYRVWDKKLSSRIVIPLLLLFLVFWTGFFSKLTREEDLAVVTAEAAAKFEPREDAPTYFDLAPGNRIKILKNDGVWAKIKRLDGKEGWVLAVHMEKI